MSPVKCRSRVESFLSVPEVDDEDCCEESNNNRMIYQKEKPEDPWAGMESRIMGYLRE